MSHFINNSDIIKKFGENAYNKIKSNTLENRIAEILQVYDNLGPNEYGLEQKDFLIACVGDCIDSSCLQAISLISNRLHGRTCRFVMSDWLQEDQFSSVKILWIVDKDTKQNEVVVGFMNKNSYTSSRG